MYDQTGSSWVLQAKSMYRFLPGNETVGRQVEALDWTWLNWLWSKIGGEWLPDQIQAINPILILIYIPLFAYIIYPLVGRCCQLTPLRKIGAGLLLTAAAFCVCAWTQTKIDAGETPSMLWQFLSYIVLTAAEVLVSLTCLEFTYTQAPRQMKSFIMSLFLLSVALGNLFTSGVNAVISLIEKRGGGNVLSGARYFWFFVGLMLLTLLIFIVYARFYREQRFIQDEAVEPAA